MECGLVAAMIARLKQYRSRPSTRLETPRSAYVAALFTRQSVTIAIGDKAHLIESLLEIKKAFPGIEVPIALGTVEVRGGV